jgi:nucleoside-diphosphate-sugar epimerase
VDSLQSPALATLGLFTALFRPGFDWWLFAPGGTDVRDIARAHVLALNSKPASEVGKKRFMLIAPDSIPSSWSQVIQLIEQERPSLKGRLYLPLNASDSDIQFEIPRKGLYEAIGFGEKDYRPWKETVLDTIDYIVDLEKKLKDRGLA